MQVWEASGEGGVLEGAGDGRVQCQDACAGGAGVQ